MKYPNAYSGVKKIFTAEILSIVSTVMFIAFAVCGIITAAAVKAAETAEAETASALNDAAAVFLIPTVLFLICGAVLAVIAFILQIAGVSKANKDEPAFRNALFFILTGVVSTVFSTVTNVLGTAVTGLLDNATLEIMNVFFSNLSRIATILVTYYIIAGIVKLADKIGNEKVAAKGKTVVNLIMIILVLSLIAAVTSNVFQKNGTNDVIAFVLSLTASVIEFAAYVIYLIFLGKAKKMLKEATD